MSKNHDIRLFKSHNGKENMSKAKRMEQNRNEKSNGI